MTIRLDMNPEQALIVLAALRDYQVDLESDEDPYELLRLYNLGVDAAVFELTEVQEVLWEQLVAEADQAGRQRPKPPWYDVELL